MNTLNIFHEEKEVKKGKKDLKEVKKKQKEQKIAQKQLKEVKVEPEVELVAELKSPNIRATRLQSAKRYSLPGPRIVSNLPNTSYIANSSMNHSLARDLLDPQGGATTKATGQQPSLPTILPRLPTSLLKPGLISNSGAMGTKGYMEVVGTEQGPLSSLFAPIAAARGASSTPPVGKSGRAYFKLPNGKWEMASKPNGKWQAATKDPNYGLVGGTIQSLLNYTKLLTFVVQVIDE